MCVFLHLSDQSMDSWVRKEVAFDFQLQTLSRNGFIERKKSLNVISSIM